MRVGIFAIDGSDEAKMLAANVGEDSISLTLIRHRRNGDQSLLDG